METRERDAEPRGFLALYPLPIGQWVVDYNDGIHWQKQDERFSTLEDAYVFCLTLPGFHEIKP